MMNKYLILFAALLFGCQQAEMPEPMPEIPSLAEHVTMATAQWNTNWSAGDAQALAGGYAEDATLYAPGAEPIGGKAAITAFWEGALPTMPYGSIATIGAENDGALGYETGTYVIEDSTGAQLDHGSYVVVWKYVDGEWKMYQDIFNSNVAPPAEDAEM